VQFENRRKSPVFYCLPVKKYLKNIKTTKFSLIFF